MKEIREQDVKDVEAVIKSLRDSIEAIDSAQLKSTISQLVCDTSVFSNLQTISKEMSEIRDASLNIPTSR